MRLTRRPETTAAADEDERDVFGMRAHVSRFRRTTFLVPDYATHRPVAERILEGTIVSPRLHRLVRNVMQQRPGSMVHAGAFFGDMLTSFSRKTPGTVYAFEPVLENYLFAHATLAANRLDNVLLLHAGLGAENAVAQIETEHPGTGRHRGGTAMVVEGERAEESPATQRVPLLTVDQLAIADLSVIQLDVEGYEAQVLRGAERSVAAHRPVIVVEDKAGDCNDLLDGWDYVEVAHLGLDRVYLPAEQKDDLLPCVPE